MAAPVSLLPVVRPLGGRGALRAAAGLDALALFGLLLPPRLAGRDRGCRLLCETASPLPDGGAVAWPEPLAGLLLVLLALGTGDAVTPYAAALDRKLGLAGL